MREYLSAECYKLFRRKYFYGALIVCLLLEGLLLWSSWFTSINGNTHSTFAMAAFMLQTLLTVGMYATLVTGDLAFSDQYRFTTLKNEVSYGIPRSRIYLGKLAAATLAAVIAAAVMLGFYLLGAWLLLPHGAGDGEALALAGYWIAGAFPLWLGAQGVAILCCFHMRSAAAGAFLSVFLLAVLPCIFQMLGYLVHPAFLAVYHCFPGDMLGRFPSDMLGQPVIDWSYAGRCWLVGLAWLIGSTAVGMVLFRKKEIR